MPYITIVEQSPEEIKGTWAWISKADGEPDLRIGGTFHAFLNGDTVDRDRVTVRDLDGDVTEIEPDEAMSLFMDFLDIEIAGKALREEVYRNTFGGE